LLSPLEHRVCPALTSARAWWPAGRHKCEVGRSAAPGGSRRGNSRVHHVCGQRPRGEKRSNSVWWRCITAHFAEEKRPRGRQVFGSTTTTGTHQQEHPLSLCFHERAGNGVRHAHNSLLRDGSRHPSRQVAQKQDSRRPASPDMQPTPAAPHGQRPKQTYCLSAIYWRVEAGVPQGHRPLQ
jgi:hypothetical protein